MITEVKHHYNILHDVVYVEKRSDFKDGEQPRYTGFKRNYRKAKYSKHDYWREHIEPCPRCWKDQSKRRHQYHRIPHFDLYCPFERDECGFVVTDEQIDELFYLVTTYPAIFGV